VEAEIQDETTIFVTGNQCPPELDEKFNDWYNRTHIPMLLESEHLEGVTRFRLTPVTEGDYPNYFTIYEFRDRQAVEAWFSGPVVRASIEEIEQTWGEERFETKWMAAYQPLKTWRKGEMPDEPVIFVTGNHCSPDQEEKLNNWYNLTHIPMLLESPYLEGVTRYRLVPVTDGDYPGYLTMYKFKNRQALDAWFSGPEGAASREERKQTWADRDFESRWMMVCEPIRAWRR